MRALLIALALCCLGQTRTEIHSYRGARARMAATVHTWTNGDADGDWANVNNWSSGALPGSGGAGLDELYITTAGGREGADTPVGALFRVKVAAKGRPEFRSRGTVP